MNVKTRIPESKRELSVYKENLEKAKRLAWFGSYIKSTIQEFGYSVQSSDDPDDKYDCFCKAKYGVNDLDKIVESVKNNVKANSYFSRIIYSNYFMSLKNIYFTFTLKNVNYRDQYLKTIIYFDESKNDLISSALHSGPQYDPRCKDLPSSLNFRGLLK